MLNIHLSNRFESLLDLMAVQANKQRGGVFEPVTVIVPSAAVQRAVTLHLADRLGLCANVDFSFPATWIWRQIARTVPGIASASPFDPDVLCWRIHRALGDAELVAGHPRLCAYLDRADDVMRFELAARCASLLEQYVTYRSDWTAQWTAGRLAASERDAPPLPDELWQAALWRRIASELTLTDEHPAQAMLSALEAGRHLDLPTSIHVIGLPSLPPLYVDLLQQLSRWIDVHVYAFNPCRAYWFEVVSARRLSWLASRNQGDLFEQGNRLLADWGRQAQAFLGSLINCGGDAIIDDGLFEPNGADSLLARLQNSILELEELAPSSVVLGPSDRSIVVHSCHSATRELEVLQDYLLGLFADDKTLSPADVLVVTPDLQSIAPLIEAVFGAVPPARRIPFAVTGLPERESNPYSRLLLDLLAFVRSRCGVTELMALVQHEAVARHFGLDEAAFEDIQAWMQASGMHWALDGRHRSELELPASDKYSLDDGLQRLFLGYSLSADTQTPFLERLPATGPEGSASRALGALWTVFETVKRLHDAAAHDRPGNEWCGLMLDALDALATPSRDDMQDLLQLRRSVHSLQEQMTQAAAVDPVPLAVVAAALRVVLEEPSRGAVPSGSITFAPLGSLRGLPYKIVCAIGLNDGSVPSSGSPCEFDLMAQRPRAGDRQRRADDRNIFLDLLLAARERLYLSHVGRSVRDNARIPPSILVSELLDVLIAAVALDKPQARERLVVEHPLQPFSPLCFTAEHPRLRSFNQEYAQALRLASRATPVPLGAAAADDDDNDEEAAWDPRAPFFSQALAPADDVWRDVPLAHLLEFFRNPSRFLLRRRMAIELPRPQELLDDDEPLLPDFDQRAALAQRLLPHAMAGLAGDELKTLALAGVEYPGGAMGERQIEAEIARVRDYADRVRIDTMDPVLPPRRIEIALDIDGLTWRVHGDYADLRSQGLVRHRYDDTRIGDYLSGWLHHLLICADAPAGALPVTRWHSRDGSYRFDDVVDPRQTLAALVRLYARGLRRPLHFFPKSAWEYVLENEDLGKAQAKWKVTAFRPYAEGADPAYTLALRGVADPLDNEFTECAKTVFGPLRACLRDPRL
jgi:exodeoxyribonuclease V gamma subunit